MKSAALLTDTIDGKRIVTIGLLLVVPIAAGLVYIYDLHKPTPRIKTAVVINRNSLLPHRFSGPCLNCHRINGQGSRTGPDLSKIGIQRRAENLRRSLIDPNAEIRSENRYLRVVTRNGDSIRGRILNQNTDSVQLRGPGGRPVSFPKQALESIELEDTSPMPSFVDRISEDELSDVLAYLLSLRGLD